MSIFDDHIKNKEETLLQLETFVSVIPTYIYSISIVRSRHSKCFDHLNQLPHTLSLSLVIKYLSRINSNSTDKVTSMCSTALLQDFTAQLSCASCFCFLECQALWHESFNASLQSACLWSWLKTKLVHQSSYLFSIPD